MDQKAILAAYARIAAGEQAASPPALLVVTLRSGTTAGATGEQAASVLRQMLNKVHAGATAAQLRKHAEAVVETTLLDQAAEAQRWCALLLSAGVLVSTPLWELAQLLQLLCATHRPTFHGALLHAALRTDASAVAPGGRERAQRLATLLLHLGATTPRVLDAAEINAAMQRLLAGGSRDVTALAVTHDALRCVHAASLQLPALRAMRREVEACAKAPRSAYGLIETLQDNICALP
jgi:hypothetical protein